MVYWSLLVVRCLLFVVCRFVLVLVFGVWRFGVWPLVFGLWPLEFGLWSFGLWSLVFFGL